MNDKWWSVLFGIVMIGCGAMFVVAPFAGWWMPEGMSSHAKDIDFLFNLILAITGFFFILTEALLIGFMYRYTPCEPGETRMPSLCWKLVKPLTGMFNTATKIEVAWTIVPAVILVYLAFAQVSTWADVKYKSRLNTALGLEKDKNGKVLQPVQLDISARQFEWRTRYPGPATWEKWKTDPEKAKTWATNPEFDDIFVVNELHCILERHVVINLSTKDVIHSFNMPHMRVKQDALPGKTIPVWFKPIKSNAKYNETAGRWEDGFGWDEKNKEYLPRDDSFIWQIACAELCGWGHYRMIGRSYIHKDEADFEAWLKWAAAHQHDFGKTAAPKN